MKYFYTYEICIENPNSVLDGCYYYGKHITDNLDDNYFGSGKLLKSYLKKYSNFGLKKTILNFFNNNGELNRAEVLLVDEKKKMLGDKCINLNVGGHGGWEFVNKNYWSILTPEEKADRMRKIALKKNDVSEVRKKIRSFNFKKMHKNMTADQKKERYDKVSSALKVYYSKASTEELDIRRQKNKESNRISSKKWRDSFFKLFMHTPEFFRKYAKMKDALDLFKQITKKDIKEQKNEVNRFMEQISC